MPGLKVRVEQGELEGFTSNTANGFAYNSYLGIPFAKPPVGELRFKDPQLPESWQGIRSATCHGNRCSQMDMLTLSRLEGDEDCLYLNVYTPASQGKNLPVMVWIYGGGFVAGSGDNDFYGPDHLVPKNVILVTFNYRVGPLGFLCLNTPEVPGNAGLKDQIFALRWVQKNIAQFGGDPQNVTIFGESAGSVSVQYMILSKMAQSLFSKAIMQSGSCLANWACERNPEKVSFDFGKKLGIDTTDKQKLLKELQKLSADSLVKGASKLLSVFNENEIMPTVEKSFPGVQSFITEMPKDIMQSGQYNKVPFICGFNSNEGVAFLDTNFCVVPKLETIDDVLPAIECCTRKYLGVEKVKADTLKKVKEFYFPKDTDIKKGFADIAGDTFFILSAMDSVELMSRHNDNIFMYCFAYDGGMNLCRMWMKYQYSGANHGDDLGYLFKMAFLSVSEDVESDDVLMLKRMTSMWTDFAKHGHPTPNVDGKLFTQTWKPYSIKETNCFRIDKDMKVVTDLFKEKINFWKELAKSEN